MNLGACIRITLLIRFPNAYLVTWCNSNRELRFKRNCLCYGWNWVKYQEDPFCWISTDKYESIDLLTYTQAQRGVRSDSQGEEEGQRGGPDGSGRGRQGHIYY